MYLAENKIANYWVNTRSVQILQDVFYKGDAAGVSAILNDELLNNPSCYDFKEENSYHMFIYGILLSVSSNYIVYSNPESGKGRSDCLIKVIRGGLSPLVFLLE